MPPDSHAAGAIPQEVTGMMAERFSALQALLDHSLEMLQQAKREEWPEVIQTGAQRQQLIECFFKEPVMPTEVEAVAPVLRQLLQINEEIETLAVDSRSGLGESIGSIQQGRRAMLAYAENTGAAAGTIGRK